MTRDEMLEEISLREELQRRESAKWGLAERIAFIRENKSREQRGEEPLPYPWEWYGRPETTPETQAAIDRIRARMEAARERIEQEASGVIVEFEGGGQEYLGRDPEEVAQIKKLDPDRKHIIVSFVSPGEEDNAI